MPVKKRTGLLELGLGSGGLAGLAVVDGWPGGRINVGGNWAVVSMGLGAAQRYAVQVQSRVVCVRARAGVGTGVSWAKRQAGLGGEKVTEEVGSVAAGRPLMLQ